MRYLFLLLAALATPAVLADDAAGTPVAPVAPAAPVAAGAEATAHAAMPEGPAEAEAPPSWVYLVARVKLKDTDLTQVAFLRHRQVTTLEACEAERAAGLTSGWRYFNRYYFRTLKGIAYQVDFRCVTGEQYLAPWRGGERLDRHYLVRTTDGVLQVEPHDTFFACRRALRQVSREETVDMFCASAGQSLLPVPLPEAEDAPADGAEVPGATMPAVPAAN